MTKVPLAVIMIRPRSRGVSGALYLQSATAGVMPTGGCKSVKLPAVRGVEARVSCNRTL